MDDELMVKLIFIAQLVYYIFAACNAIRAWHRDK